MTTSHGQNRRLISSLGDELILNDLEKLATVSVVHGDHICCIIYIFPSQHIKNATGLTRDARRGRPNAKKPPAPRSLLEA